MSEMGNYNWTLATGYKSHSTKWHLHLLSNKSGRIATYLKQDRKEDTEAVAEIIVTWEI